MSIVSLSDGSGSQFTLEHLRDIATQLNIDISNDRDANDYLRLLWSFESVMKKVEDGSDYIHPKLKPTPVTKSREFWKPTPEDNPYNAWSHRCDLCASSPTSDILKGRTVAIKDNISVGGLPTTLGASPFLLSENGVYQSSPIDATAVSRLLSSGALIKGTSTCECFCASPLSFTSSTGPVHNPRLKGYTSGGSSSGSSVLVAAHSMNLSSQCQTGTTVELAIGTDQAGSVRIPASFNGIYGLKPTFGLVPYTGAASMSSMIDYLGPIAPRIEDIAAMLEVMAGYDGLDPRMTPESPLLNQVKPYREITKNFRHQISTKSNKAGRGWKIGLLKESFIIPGVSTDVRDTVQKAAREFFEATGATVLDISVPLHKEGSVIWTASTRPSMANWLCQGKTGGHLIHTSPHLQPRWPPSQETYDIMTACNPALTNIVLSERFADKFLPAGVEAKAHRKVFELREAYDTALQEVDVLITPCAPTIAMPHPETVDSEGRTPSILERLQAAIGLTSNTCPFNVTGHPAMNVPCGFSSPPGHPDVQLPIGMQVIGQRWADEKVMMAAALFEKGRESANPT